MNISEETIDSFLRGDLSEPELTAFNKAVSADPKLQQEVSFQRDIIDAVKQHRHQQLKDRLNAIDIKPVGVGFFSSQYFKLAASVGIVALIVGSFSIFNNNSKEENTTTIVESSVTGTESTEKLNEETPITSLANTTAENTNTASTPLAEDANSKITAQTSTTKPKATTTNNKKQKETAGANIAFEDLSEEPMDLDNNIEGINDNFNMPSMNHGGNASNISAPQIKVSIVKENNLGYRFFNNQLFLHGNFSNSPYELFELNNKPSKQLFLYFEDNYYELLQGKTKLTALTPITDKVILLQLTQLREH